MANVLSNLILDVGDLDRSIEFYHGLLKLPVRRQEQLDGHRLAYLDSGGVEVLLLQQPPEDQNPELNRRGGLVIKFYVQGLPGLASNLVDHQVPMLRDVEQSGMVERSCLVSDPDGYAVLLAERMGPLN